MIGAAASGGRKVIPRQVRLCPSALLLALLHSVACQLKGETLSRWAMWSSSGTALMPRRAAKDATGISVIEGSPSGGQLPTTPKQPTVWILRTNRDREEGVWNLRFSVPVNPEKFQDRQTRYWGLLSGEAPQEGVNPPSLTVLRG